MTLKETKSTLFNLSDRANSLASRIITHARVTYTEDVYNAFGSQIDTLKRDLLTLKKDLEKHPKISMHFITEEQIKGHSFGFLEWRSAGTILRGRFDFFTHPLLNIEVISAVELLELVVVRLYELNKEKLKIVEKEITVHIKNFDFTVNENWDRKLRIESPAEWFVMGSPMGDYHYSIKIRAIRFLQTFKLAPKGYPFRFRWRRLTDEEMSARKRARLPMPAKNRRLIIDPEGKIAVRATSRRGDRRRWSVDFSAFRFVPKSVDMEKLIKVLREKNYSYD